MLTCDRCDSFITRELLFKLHIQEKHTDEFDSTNTDEEIYTDVETGEETAEKLLDDVENEAPGHTIAFIAGKSSMVGQPRGIRSALAKMDWHEMCESDDHAEYFEDNDDGNVGVPDDRPAVPDVQMLQASPLYALPAYRECGPGNSYESNYGLLTEPMLNFPRIQADEHEDQEDVFTAVQNLAVDKDLEMDALDAMNIAKRNALNPGMNTMEGVDMSRVTQVGVKADVDEIDSEEENENLSKRLQLLRSWGLQEFEDCRLVLKLFLGSEESKCLGPSLSNP